MPNSFVALIYNVLIDTKRSVYNATTKQTAAPTAKLSSQKAHIRSTANAALYHAIIPSALETDYELMLDSGTDIAEGDILSKIVEKDGTTPWPGLGLAASPIVNELFRVVVAHESVPRLWPVRYAYLKREEAGGVLYE